MTGMWVAVTAEYNGATFSHRAQSPVECTNKSRALWGYNCLLDEAGSCVRNGFAGWLPSQDEVPETIGLSTHEKLRAIQKIVTHQSEARTPELDKIREVLDR